MVTNLRTAALSVAIMGLSACGDERSASDVDDLGRRILLTDAAMMADARIEVWGNDPTRHCDQSQAYQTRCAGANQLDSLCSGPIERCINNNWQPCEPYNITQAGGEVCDGIDNNCNNFIDEDARLAYPDEPYAAANGYARLSLECERDPFWAQESRCTPGRKYCLDARLSDECVGGNLPQLERCDGKDQDCDGILDESNTREEQGSGIPLSKPCYIEINEAGESVIKYLHARDDPAPLEANEVMSFPDYIAGRVGICRAGRDYCDEGKLSGTCAEAVAPLGYDICGDGLDTNCDGLDAAPQRQHVHFVLDISGSMSQYYGSIVEEIIGVTQRIDDDGLGDRINYSLGLIGAVHGVENITLAFIDPTQQGVDGLTIREAFSIIQQNRPPNGGNEYTHEAVLMYLRAVFNNEIQSVPSYRYTPQEQGADWQFGETDLGINSATPQTILVMADENPQTSGMDLEMIAQEIHQLLRDQDSLIIINLEEFAMLYANLPTPRNPDGSCVRDVANRCVGYYPFSNAQEVGDAVEQVLNNSRGCLEDGL